jgi:hypothetical protein
VAKQKEAAQAAAFEPFSGQFFASRHALKFHKKQLLTGCHFGLYGTAFSCQTNPDLPPSLPKLIRKTFHG